VRGDGFTAVGRPLSRLTRLALGLIGACALWVLVAAAPPPIAAPSGMVATDSALASRVGSDILQAGGNAADAAVARALAVGVVHPHSSGSGGGGFALYYAAESGDVTVLDFRERAPACSTSDMFVRDGEVVSELTVRSGLAVAVPGEVAGLWALHQRFGRLPWAQVVAPAVALAREFEVDHELARWIPDLEAFIVDRPPLEALLRDAEGAWIRPGERHSNAGLAATLSLIAERGPAGFYTGPVAQSVVDSVVAGGGCMSLADLEAYEVRELEPLVGAYRGLQMYTMPPPSSGGITMLQILAVLEGFELSELGHNSSAYLHTLVEALQFGFADRAVYLGDPGFVDIPVEALLAPELAAARRALFQSEATLERDAYGMEGQSAYTPDDDGTSHLWVVDADRNVVALTTTINTRFGSMLVTADTGIVLNNEMADFNAQPGVPNVYGLLGNEENGIEAGKTPLSSMSPTIVLRDGAPVMTLGASGGPRIITGTLQTFLNVVDFDMNISDAVSAPRVHHQWVPERVFVEPEHPRDVTSGLEGRRHEVAPMPAIGAVQAIVVGTDGWLYGASDPRKGGLPVGY